MFYAIRTQAIAADVVERQLMSFYTKADRAGYIAKNEQTAPISSVEARKCKPAGASFTVSDKQLDTTYFSQIVL